MFIEVNCSHCDKIYDAEVQGTDYELKQLGSKFGSCPSCKDKDNDNPYGALMGHKADSIIKIVDEASFVTKSSQWIAQDKAKELYPPQCRHENWKDVDSDRKRECLDCPMVMNVSTGGNHLFEWRTPGSPISHVVTTQVIKEAREALLKNGQGEVGVILGWDMATKSYPPKNPSEMDLEEYGAYLKETKEKDLTCNSCEHEEDDREDAWFVGVAHPKLEDEKWEPDEDEDDDDPHADCDHDSLKHGADCRFCGWCPGVDEDEDCDHERVDRTPTTGTFTCLDCDLRIDEGHEGYMQAFRTYFNTKEVPHGHMDSPYRREDLDGSSRPYPGGSRATDPPDSANLPRHKYSRMDLVQMLDHLRSNGMEYYHIPCKLPAQAVIQPSLRLMAECNHANWQEFDFGHSRKCQDCGLENDLMSKHKGDRITIGLRGNLIGGKVESNEHIKIESKVKLDPKSENMKFNLAQLVMKQHAKDSEAMARDMDAAVVKGLMEIKTK